jgi:hypothetical protein
LDGSGSEGFGSAALGEFADFVEDDAVEAFATHGGDGAKAVGDISDRCVSGCDGAADGCADFGLARVWVEAVVRPSHFAESLELAGDAEALGQSPRLPDFKAGVSVDEAGHQDAGEVGAACPGELLP